MEAFSMKIKISFFLAISIIICLAIGCGKKSQQKSDPAQNKNLIEAIKKGDTAKVREAINAGADVNLLDTTDQYANRVYDHALSLSWSKETCIKLTKLLVDAKLDVNLTDYHGETPLMRASNIACADAVKILIEAKADVNAKNKENGRTPIIYAVMAQGGPNHGEFAETLKLLITAKADVNAKDKGGKTAKDYLNDYGETPDPILLKIFKDAGAK
jgi:uncharacterized protein